MPACPGIATRWTATSNIATSDRLPTFSLACTPCPRARDASLDPALRSLDASVPLLIDEADGSLDAFPRAVEYGWRGVSSKSCKGLYKALVNRARCEQWNANAQQEGLPARWFMSAE